MAKNNNNNTAVVDEVEEMEEVAGFDLVTADIPKPTRKQRQNVYAKTIENFLASGKRSQQIILRHPVTKAEINPKSAVPGFRNVIGRKHPDEVRLVQRQNALFLERIKPVGKEEAA